MTINELQNVTYENVGTVGWRITANEGYCIHLVTHRENEYARIIVIPVSYDLSTIQVLLIADLPEGSEVHGGGNDTETVTE